MNTKDNRCHIGPSAVSSYVLVVFDALLNACLTLFFVVLLRRVLQYRGSALTGDPMYDTELGSVASSRQGLRRRWLSRRTGEVVNESFRLKVKAVLRKNVIGSALMFLASAANGITLIADNGAELSYICLIACLADSRAP